MSDISEHEHEFDHMNGGSWCSGCGAYEKDPDTIRERHQPCHDTWDDDAQVLTCDETARADKAETALASNESYQRRLKANRDEAISYLIEQRDEAIQQRDTLAEAIEKRMGTSTHETDAVLALVLVDYRVALDALQTVTRSASDGVD